MDIDSKILSMLYMESVNTIPDPVDFSDVYNTTTTDLLKLMFECIPVFYTFLHNHYGSEPFETNNIEPSVMERIYDHAQIKFKGYGGNNLSAIIATFNLMKQFNWLFHDPKDTQELAVVCNPKVKLTGEQEADAFGDML